MRKMVSLPTMSRSGRRLRYRLDRLIERYGIDAKLFKSSDEITADCPRKQAMNLNDICGARCPTMGARQIARPSVVATVA
jgi:hypothetical protein